MNEVMVTNTERDLAVGTVANHYSNMNKLNEYVASLSANTKRAQLSDLETFCIFLGTVTIVRTVAQLREDVGSWAFISHGLVDGFKQWLGNSGYSVSSMNRALSTVKTYCNVAYSAEIISVDVNNKIRMIKSVESAVNFDNSRKDKELLTRISTKKATSTEVTAQQVKELKQQPSTAVGIRNSIIIHLCFDYALRVSEIANLRLSDIDLNRDELTVYRIKTDTTDRFSLLAIPDFYKKLKKYVTEYCFVGQEFLLRGSLKSGVLTQDCMNERNIAKLIEKLGNSVGIEKLSPHDGRHTWATNAVKANVNAFAIQQYGGWNSMETVKRYVNKAKVISVGSVYGE